MVTETHYKGRLEFLKDVRAVYSAASVCNGYFVKSIIASELPMCSGEVEFVIVAVDRTEEEAITDFLASVWEASELPALKERYIEPHVFCQSVKRVSEYDGNRDQIYWRMRGE